LRTRYGGADERPVKVDGVVTQSKTQLRGAILAARRAVTDDVRVAEATALGKHLPTLVNRGDTVCAYVPVGAEPGSLELLDSMVALGARVLLPVARTSGDAIPLALQWGVYRPGALAAAPFGLREPAQPWLTAEALSDAAVVLVPALAVDRRGVRLGRGAGFYDRSLGLADPAARLVAVVRDTELVPELPAEAHDLRMTHALTPGLGVVALSEG
jgi:5-formyltetrahydrofolate cyclo-ligase